MRFCTIGVDGQIYFNAAAYHEARFEADILEMTRTNQCRAKELLNYFSTLAQNEVSRVRLRFSTAPGDGAHIEDMLESLRDYVCGSAANDP